VHLLGRSDPRPFQRSALPISQNLLVEIVNQFMEQAVPVYFRL
jgi:hypothetical protein